MSDPIADMLTRVRNASARKAKKVSVPFSNVKYNLAKVMEKEGYIQSVSVDGVVVTKKLIIVLKYHGSMSEPVCASLVRYSRPGLRCYKKWNEIPRNGFGIVVVSTSQGMMSDHDARSKHLGGEMICKLSTVKSEG